MIIYAMESRLGRLHKSCSLKIPSQSLLLSGWQSTWGCWVFFLVLNMIPRLVATFMSLEKGDPKNALEILPEVLILF